MRAKSGKAYSRLSQSLKLRKARIKRVARVVKRLNVLSSKETENKDFGKGGGFYKN